MKTFYAYKHSTGHVYNADGKRLLITRLSVNPLVIAQIKTKEKDFYSAVQVALGKKKKLNKPMQGHLKGLNFNPRHLKEIKTENTEVKKKFDQIKPEDVFVLGDIVNVYATSKGKGFAGGIKRWGFAGGPKTHGQSDRHRAPGSIGQGTTPGRVFKGKKMAGHMGAKKVCIRNSQIISINSETNQIWITGTVPGPNGGLVQINKINHKDFTGLFSKNKDKDLNDQKNNK